MIGKKPAFIIILIASFLYLAHAVIPHHHHEEHICIGLEPHRDHSNGHNCETDRDHNPDDKSEDENCIIQHEVLLPSKQLKENLINLETFNDLPDFFSFTAVANNSSSNFNPLCEFSADSQFIPTSGCKEFIFLLNGLRAPPVIFLS